MKTTDSRFDKGTQSGKTFPNEVLREELPKVYRLSERVKPYNEDIKLYVHENDRTRNVSKHPFVVDWQM